MKKKSKYLVVGGDSFVGAELFRSLERHGHVAFASTRNKDSIDAKRVYLNFESKDHFTPPPGVDYAFIVAAATNYDRCENDPLAELINVHYIPSLAESLLKQGVFVTFISTNSVFGGERPWPHEDDPHAPGIAYARQKDDAEKAICTAAERLKAEKQFNIVRLTKILDQHTSPLPNWFETWRKGKIVKPFSDLIFAPMSPEFVSKALVAIGEKRVSGNLHLSGAENVSYVDLAASIAERLDVNDQLIEPTTAEEKGIHILFKPTYSGLGMSKTTELTGIMPQMLTDVVSDLTGQLSVCNMGDK